jgi:hypothetical protein
MKNFVFKILCAFLLYSVPSLSQDGIHEHDGFFLRILLGAGYAELVEEDVMGSDLKFSGATVPLRFQIGGKIGTNFIFFGEFGFASQENPEMEWMEQSGSTSDVTVSVGDLGLGITYYNAVNLFSLSGLYVRFVGYNNTSDQEINFLMG